MVSRTTIEQATASRFRICTCFKPPGDGVTGGRAGSRHRPRPSAASAAFKSESRPAPDTGRRAPRPSRPERKAPRLLQRVVARLQAQPVLVLGPGRVGQRLEQVERPVAQDAEELTTRPSRSLSVSSLQAVAQQHRGRPGARLQIGPVARPGGQEKNEAVQAAPATRRRSSAAPGGASASCCSSPWAGQGCRRIWFDPFVRVSLAFAKSRSRPLAPPAGAGRPRPRPAARQAASARCPASSLSRHSSTRSSGPK